MSHELSDNKYRRLEIVRAIPLEEGIHPNDFLILVMDFGYNRRGAREKIEELIQMKRVVQKGGRIYPTNKGLGLE